MSTTNTKILNIVKETVERNKNSKNKSLFQLKFEEAVKNKLLKEENAGERSKD